MRDIMEALADGSATETEAMRLGTQILHWLRLHLGWQGEQLTAHFGGLVGREDGAAKLARAWFPGCSYMAGLDHRGLGCATLFVRGASSPMVATAPHPADALLLACFKAYALRQERDAWADGIAQVVA